MHNASPAEVAHRSAAAASHLLALTLDSANWVLTVKATGELASSTTAANTRVTADARAIHYENRWVVREVTLNRDDPC